MTVAELIKILQDEYIGDIKVTVWDSYYDYESDDVQLTWNEEKRSVRIGT